ncbi:hypothetical protein FACS1894166_10240 [Bacilli bacterium]|nr:hypothetical protein FACS1894166_10240 [Bacilli bacterium]
MITYPRSDSTRLSGEYISKALDFLKTKYDSKELEFLKSPADYEFNKSAGKNTQDAHEAIHPVDPAITPEIVVKNITDADKADLIKLYTLIYERSK